MKNKVLAFLAILVIVGTGWYVLQPEGFVPLFDANLRQLAMTAKEARCSGEVYVQPRNMEEKAVAAAACRADPDNASSEEIDLITVVPTFCLAIISQIASTYTECVTTMSDMQFWPLYNGGITNVWNVRSAPYPLDVLQRQGSSDDSRTGDRDLLERTADPKN